MQLYSESRIFVTWRVSSLYPSCVFMHTFIRKEPYEWDNMKPIEFEMAIVIVIVDLNGYTFLSHCYRKTHNQMKIQLMVTSLSNFNAPEFPK